MLLVSLACTLGYYNRITLVNYLKIRSFYLQRLRNYWMMSWNSGSKPDEMSLCPPGLTNMRKGDLSVLRMYSRLLKQLDINLRF